MHAVDLVRGSFIAIWSVVLVGGFVLRLNPKYANPTILRYMAYLGYTDPQNPTNPPTVASKSTAKSTAH